MGWACFFCGPLPFSGTPVCKAGDNVWANYQGYCISAQEDGTIINQWLCSGSPMAKVGGAPPTATMER